MNRVLVPILTADDLPNLPILASALAELRPEVVVILNSPSVGVTASDLTAEIDKQIEKLEQSKLDATAREDFDAAKAWKGQIEERKMDRQSLLRDGWKQVSADARQSAYDTAIIHPLREKLEPLGVTIQQAALPEDSTHEDFHGTMANLVRNWPFESLPLGKFSTIPPRSTFRKAIVAAPQPISSESKGTTAPKPPKAQKTVSAPLTRDEKREFYRKYFMAFRKSAKELGLNIVGQDKNSVIELILDRDFPAAA